MSNLEKHLEEELLFWSWETETKWQMTFLKYLDMALEYWLLRGNNEQRRT